jgi:hypothetical protein
MKHPGHNLIFLISQPRAGSTLTQRILGSHSQIHTQSEPWIMLHPLNALKSNNIQASYDMDLYIRGATDFIDHLPGKMKYYKNNISEAYSSLYNSILDREKKNLFLDKTPRYYYIIEELSEFFPAAKFIFLWRNPAAVLVSIINSWSKLDWYRLSEWRDDLLLGPELINNGIRKLGNKAFYLRYEDLLADPIHYANKICSFLDIPFQDDIVNYGDFKISDWRFGDQNTVRKKNSPDPTHADKWQDSLNNPQLWSVVNEYINRLGKHLIEKMGYSFLEIITILEKYQPSIEIQNSSIPFATLINNTRDSFIENKRLHEKLRNASEGFLRRDELIKNHEETLKKQDHIIKENDFLTSSLQTKLKYLEAELNENQKIIHEFEQTLKQKDILIQEKDSQLSKQLKTLSNIDLKLKESNKILFKKLSESKSIVEQYLLVSKQLKQKESDINNLNKEFVTRQQETEFLKNETIRLKEKIKSHESDLETLKELIKSKDNLIHELKVLINNIEKSYTFRIGTFLIKPAWQIKNLFK